MIQAEETPAYLAEVGVSIAYVITLQTLKDADLNYDPDLTWLAVVGGVLISAAPAVYLARVNPGTSWQEYERRSTVGFCLSGLVIVAWQLWQYAFRHGRLTGFDLALQIQGETDADAAPPVECQSGRAARRR